MEEHLTGLDICKQFRERGGETLILLLTGKTSPRDVEIGLDAGADDYFRKPFHMDELSAKVRSLLRRAVGTRTDKSIACGDLRLDPIAHEVWRGQ